MRINALFCAIFMLCFSSCYCSANWLKANQAATLIVDGSPTSRKIPDTMFGIFFEVHYILVFVFLQIVMNVLIL